MFALIAHDADDRLNKWIVGLLFLVAFIFLLIIGDLIAQAIPKIRVAANKRPRGQTKRNPPRKRAPPGSARATLARSASTDSFQPARAAQRSTARRAAQYPDVNIKPPGKAGHKVKGMNVR